MKCEWCNKKAEVRIYGEHLCTYHYLRIYIDELKKDKNENTKSYAKLYQNKRNKNPPRQSHSNIATWERVPFKQHPKGFASS
jgi:hypothetical protein